MTSESSSTEEPRKAIEKDGFFCRVDPIIGKRVDEFAKKGYPFKTEEGLDFCKLNTLDDERVLEVLESLFTWSALGLFKAYSSDPRYVCSFLDPRKTSKLHALIVQLWSSGSQAVFYKHSHLQSQVRKVAANGLLEIPQDQLSKDTIERVEVEMKEGGLAVCDARLGFTVIKGIVVTIAFAVEEELVEWAKMRLPNSPNFKKKVATMTRAKIGTNFHFQE
ncbi:MAG: hypothetical protein M1839_005289 [Geoglossum umbratile]|nr:MAG: hypothetical protein M1839_005289 [Geoglossum umbratile]